jgi:hypothetical protein
MGRVAWGREGEFGERKLGMEDWKREWEWERAGKREKKARKREGEMGRGRDILGDCG